MTKYLDCASLIPAEDRDGALEDGVMVTWCARMRRLLCMSLFTKTHLMLTAAALLKPGGSLF